MPKSTIPESLRHFIGPLLLAIVGSLAASVNCPRNEFSGWRVVRKLATGIPVGIAMVFLVRIFHLTPDQSSICGLMGGLFADDFLLLFKGKVTRMLK